MIVRSTALGLVVVVYRWCLSSQTNAFVYVSIDERSLTERVGRLDLSAQRQLDAGIRLALDLAG